MATKYKYRYGKAYDLNFYTADGTAFDYMAGVRKVGSMERWAAERGVCGGGGWGECVLLMLLQSALCSHLAQQMGVLEILFIIIIIKGHPEGRALLFTGRGSSLLASTIFSGSQTKFQWGENSEEIFYFYEMYFVSGMILDFGKLTLNTFCFTVFQNKHHPIMLLSNLSVAIVGTHCMECPELFPFAHHLYNYDLLMKMSSVVIVVNHGDMSGDNGTR